MSAPVLEVNRLIEVLAKSAQGRARALTARQLKDHGFSDRELRALAHEAATAGVLVCADNAGYFLPASREEVAECIGRLRSQGQEMLARACTLERLAFRQFNGSLF